MRIVECNYGDDHGNGLSPIVYERDSEALGVPGFMHESTNAVGLVQSPPDDFCPSSSAVVPISKAEALEQLSRILTSKTFIKAKRSKDFLRYVVSKALAGEAHQMKEYAIALDVFERDASFDPRLDPIVRVEAARLRCRMKEYLDNVVVRDSIHIEVPKGGYAPLIRRCIASDGPTPPKISEAASMGAIGVLPFLNLCGAGRAENICEGITEELIQGLTTIHGLRTPSRTAVFQFKDWAGDIFSFAEKLHVSALLEGSVSMTDSQLRVTVRLVDCISGFTIKIGTFTQEGRDLCSAQDGVCKTIIEAFTASWISGVLSRSLTTTHGANGIWEE